jgi:hypothetical protein
VDIFTDEDMLAMEEGNGFKTKMEKALFADAIRYFSRSNLWYI